MIIGPNSAVILETGESFIEERQDDENIWRIATYKLASGAEVKVSRHFSTIGPLVTRPDGSRIDTHFSAETNSVKEVDARFTSHG